MDRRLERPGIVEILVGEQRFGRVGARFLKVFAGSRESQVVLADVLQPATGAEIGSGLVRRGDVEQIPSRRRPVPLPARVAVGISATFGPVTNDARQFQRPTLSGET